MIRGSPPTAEALPLLPQHDELIGDAPPFGFEPGGLFGEEVAAAEIERLAETR